MLIFYIIGPSGSGKDLVFTKLMEFFIEILKPIVLYTNRPIRPGEVDGITYNFMLLETIIEMDKAGIVIEQRKYDTIHGPWIYATVDDGSFKDDGKYIGIGTLESLIQIQEYFGCDKVVPLFIWVSPDVRIQRLVSRELDGKKDFDEMCRRWLADCNDFNKDKIESVEPIIIDNNNDIDSALNQAISIVKKYI